MASCLAESSRVDVFIYGATPAGIAAAVAVHDAGLLSIIVEPSSHIGGMMTGGLSAADLCTERAIGGFSRSVFERIGKVYGESFGKRFEPSVAQNVFAEIIQEKNLHILSGVALQSLNKQGTRILSVKLSNGKTVEAKMFLDASYEADLLPLAQVSSIVGREAQDTYRERLAGVRHDPGFLRHQFHATFSGRDASGKLLPGIQGQGLAPLGSADNKVPAYNFRPCITKRPDIRIPFYKPAAYAPAQYALLANYLAVQRKLTHRDLFTILKIPNGKFDLNNGGPFSTNLIGGSWEYPEGNAEKRARIADAHARYIQGLLYFLSHDKKVPEHIRKEVSSWSYCGDEFQSTKNFPPQLYVRQARRLIGEYVLVQRDIFRARRKVDSVGMASCPIESHHVQRVLLDDGRVFNEGHVQKPVLPYQIPYRSLLPKAQEAENLIVPVALSASHIAYTSLRMEPVYMILGESAGVAAALAIEQDVAFQELPYDELRGKLLERGQVLGEMPGIQPPAKPSCALCRFTKMLRRFF